MINIVWWRLRYQMRFLTSVWSLNCLETLSSTQAIHCISRIMRWCIFEFLLWRSPILQKPSYLLIWSGDFWYHTNLHSWMRRLVSEIFWSWDLHVAISSRTYFPWDLCPTLGRLLPFFHLLPWVTNSFLWAQVLNIGMHHGLLVRHQNLLIIALA